MEACRVAKWPRRRPRADTESPPALLLARFRAKMDVRKDSDRCRIDAGPAPDHPVDCIDNQTASRRDGGVPSKTSVKLGRSLLSPGEKTPRWPSRYASNLLNVNVPVGRITATI